MQLMLVLRWQFVLCILPTALVAFLISEARGCDGRGWETHPVLMSSFRAKWMGVFFKPIFLDRISLLLSLYSAPSSNPTNNILPLGHQMPVCLWVQDGTIVGLPNRAKTVLEIKPGGVKTGGVTGELAFVEWYLKVLLLGFRVSSKC